MEVVIQTDVKITLVLSLKEAQFLKGLVQNPMCDPDDELLEDKEIRRRFWDAIPHDLAGS